MTRSVASSSAPKTNQTIPVEDILEMVRGGFLKRSGRNNQYVTLTELAKQAAHA